MAKRTFLILGTAAAITAGCSVLIDVDGKQCEADADCRARGFVSAVCQQSLCVTGDGPGPGGAGGAGGADGSGTPLVCTPPEPNDSSTQFTTVPWLLNITEWKKSTAPGNCALAPPLTSSSPTMPCRR